MSARSIWNGTLTFGTVAIPIKVFSATESRGLSFKEVREADGARIAHRRVGAESGEPIEYADVEKGHDDGRGLVVLTKEEIAAADGPRPKVVAIEHFVRSEEIDPVFYDKPYHLGANTGGGHGYRVLLRALQRSERVGIGRFVMRSREQLVAVRPIDGALGMQTMRFDDQLVDPSDLELPSLRKKPKEREVEMARRLVEMMVGEWDPAAHRDTYREAVMDLIERKRQGKAPKRAKKREDAGDDLAAALEASLEGRGGGSKRGSAKKASKKAAPRSAAARETPSSRTKPSREPGSGKQPSSAQRAAVTRRQEAARGRAAAKKKDGGS